MSVVLAAIKLYLYGLNITAEWLLLVQRLFFLVRLGGHGRIYLKCFPVMICIHGGIVN